MKQSRVMSLVETIANVVVGYGQAELRKVLVFRMFGLHTTLVQKLKRGAMFKIVSIGRGFALRRLFETLARRRNLGETEPAHCLLGRSALAIAFQKAIAHYRAEEVSMNKPVSLLPEDEEQRLHVLRRYDILDTPPDGAFDRVTSLAARLFNVPIAIVSLVDRDRIWFKSKQGVDVHEIGREPGLCASAILQNGPWLLSDASIDPRAMANPLVTGELGLRFYLGAPLRTWDGHNLGTLCVIDQKPREVSSAELEHLHDLATLVMDQMELRLTARTAVAQREMLLRELHHRVKNNLQILLSVVSTSERRARSAETVEFMRSLRGRLVALSSAHDAMRTAESLGQGRTGELLEQICHTIKSALGGNGEFVTEIEDHEVSNEVLLPLALILNELLTNAFKHGLQNGSGRIHVRFRGTGTSYELTVRDSGPGFSEADTTPDSLGLVFIKGLALQIGGEFHARNENGAVCSVAFPA